MRTSRKFQPSTPKAPDDRSVPVSGHRDHADVQVSAVPQDDLRVPERESTHWEVWLRFPDSTGLAPLGDHARVEGIDADGVFVLTTRGRRRHYPWSSVIFREEVPGG